MTIHAETMAPTIGAKSAVLLTASLVSSLITLEFEYRGRLAAGDGPLALGELHRHPVGDQRLLADLCGALACEPRG